MQRAQRRLLFSVFAASIFVTLVSIVHAYFVLGPSGLSEALTANVEASVSLIVCNLAVLATWAYRRARGGADGDSSGYGYGSSGAPVSGGHTGGGTAGVSLKRLKGASGPGQVSALRFASANQGESRLVFGDEEATTHVAGKSFVDVGGDADAGPERDEKPFAAFAWTREDSESPDAKGVHVTQETYTRA